MIILAPRLGPLALAAGLAAAGAGCAQVFGLDDYALGEGGTAAPGGTTGTTSGGGGDVTTSGTGASGTTSSTGSGSGGAPPADCRCIPEVPAGWSVVTALPTTVEAPPAECQGDRRVTVGDVEADCACTCAEVATDCTATLRCWDEVACAGGMGDYTLGPDCSGIGTRRSCSVIEGTPAGPSCQAGGVVGPRLGDAFDLCGATLRDAPDCSASERCADAPEEVELCIEGEGECPDGWGSVVHEAAAFGDFECDECACSARTCAGARFKAGENFSCPTDLIAEFGAPGCVDVRNGFTQAAAQAGRMTAPGSLTGTCDPLVPGVPATYAAGAPTTLCCLPSP